MSRVGPVLKQAREEKGISLEQAARELNLRKKYLKALEADDYSKTPAEVYTIGFIRSYARYLDLDPESLVTKYKMNAGDAEEATVGQPDRSSFFWGLLVFLSVASLLTIGFRVHLHQSEELESKIIEPPLRNNEPVVPEVQSDTSRTQETENLQLDVIAVEETWMFVIFDGMRKREILLQPGETISWKAEEAIRLRLGNAGGIKLYHNGVELPSLGESGEVKDLVVTYVGNELEVREAEEAIAPGAGR